jgi:hypothetical protein
VRLNPVPFGLGRTKSPELHREIDAHADAEKTADCHLLPVLPGDGQAEERDGRRQEDSEQDGQLLARMSPARLLVHAGTVTTRPAG